MKVYSKFLCINYIKSFSYVFIVMLSLVIILNVLTEVEFFRNYEVNIYLPIYLAIINSLDLVFEMFPFIFLISTQVFFVNLMTDNQLNIFKYSGLKNSKIIIIISFLTFLMGLIIITLFYSLSSNLKNLYLESKNKFTTNNEYLAVASNNGLWIKDIVDNKKFIINASEIENNFLKNTVISQFDDNFYLTRIIVSEKIDIKNNEWILINSKIIENNENREIDKMTILSNFNFEKINNLFSELSSLSMLELFNLRNNYKNINYSTIEIDSQILKLISYPLYFVLMTILSAIIMFNTKKFKSTSLKIIIGLFSCVIIYYVNNLFQVLGNTERISLFISVWITFAVLIFFNAIFIREINDK